MTAVALNVVHDVGALLAVAMVPRLTALSPAASIVPTTFAWAFD